MSNKISVGLVGAGAMGGALLRGWLAADTIDLKKSAIFDPAPSDALQSLSRKHGFALNGNPSSAQIDVLVAAVKPQAAARALAAYAAPAAGAVVISVMAGKSVKTVSDALGGAPRVARAMPNLPTSIARGVTGLYAPPAIDAAGRDMIERLMAAVGETVWVNSEEEIDFVTAVSGSGPAYFFLLTEALAEAGEALGLDRAAAEKLARATCSGAGALLDSDERSAGEMAQAVTSPAGTTEAALELLDGDDKALRILLKKAVQAAARRASQLTD